jgi:hypothetical protein
MKLVGLLCWILNANTIWASPNVNSMSERFNSNLLQADEILSVRKRKDKKDFSIFEPYHFLHSFMTKIFVMWYIIAFFYVFGASLSLTCLQ